MNIFNPDEVIDLALDEFVPTWQRIACAGLCMLYGLIGAIAFCILTVFFFCLA